MVDFSKRLGDKGKLSKRNPIEIYDHSDRTSEAGPLRPSQEFILQKWFSDFQEQKDVIIKLHTGQGKTLIGLLILQSKLNQERSPTLYLCTNKQLVNQTCLQADKFGIKYCQIEDDGSLPFDFIEGNLILITHVQKLFNGLSKFGTGNKSLDVNHIVIDDSHACIDTIKDSFTIRLGSDHIVYEKIIELFTEELKGQGAGTFADVLSGDFESILTVPYWTWLDKIDDVIKIISESKTDKQILFAWQLVKDLIDNSTCYLSGNGLEIKPNFNPIEKYGSFEKAKHRVFMSASTMDDSFLIRGLGISKDVVLNALKYDKETWAGEKMIILPTLIDPQLTRTEIVNSFAKPNPDRKFGVVALAPSDKGAKFWETCGAIRADKYNIDDLLLSLKQGKFSKTIAVSNRYDGIDLPDSSCRILILDSKPFPLSLSDRYEEQCREYSELVNLKLAQKIEQGLGRSVRGEKDYSIIILSGTDLANIIWNPKTKIFFSQQTISQIEIGLSIVKFTKEDNDSDKEGFEILNEVINQCLNREDGWKAYYEECMNNMEGTPKPFKVYEILELERQAEQEYLYGSANKAIELIQKIINSFVDNQNEVGWYLQEIARYKYKSSKADSNKYQIEAHQKNHLLLKPKDGMAFEKMEFKNQSRIKNIKDWIKQFDDYSDLEFELDEILEGFSIGKKADVFELNTKKLGLVLGFLSERPEKEWKEGPDNLWCLKENDFLLFECKSEVNEKRKDIVKKETGQLSNSIKWFETNYGLSTVTYVMIINTRLLAKGAGTTKDFKVLRKKGIQKLKNNVKSFFREFQDTDLKSLNESKINEFIYTHELDEEKLKKNYLEETVNAY